MNAKVKSDSSYFCRWTISHVPGVMGLLIKNKSLNAHNVKWSLVCDWTELLEELEWDSVVPPQQLSVQEPETLPPLARNTGGEARSTGESEQTRTGKKHTEDRPTDTHTHTQKINLDVCGLSFIPKKISYSVFLSLWPSLCLVAYLSSFLPACLSLLSYEKH